MPWDAPRQLSADRHVVLIRSTWNYHLDCPRFLAWLNALERLVTEKGVAGRDTLARHQHAWDHAAERTPHGEPIELAPQDFDRA